jgi:hypothetical protein
VQLTSDGHRPYLEAVESAFGSEIDYSMLIKMYGRETGKGETRYSPPVCIGARRRKIIGNPDRNLISTSFVERQNLTLRMTNRRFILFCIQSNINNPIKTGEGLDLGG